ALPRRDVDARHELLDLGRPDQTAVDSHQLVYFGTDAQPADAALGVRDAQVSLLRKEHVVAELDRHSLIELDGFVVERDALGRSVIRSDDGGVPAAGAAA